MKIIIAVFIYCISFSVFSDELIKDDSTFNEIVNTTFYWIPQTSHLANEHFLDDYDILILIMKRETLDYFVVANEKCQPSLYCSNWTFSNGELILEAEYLDSENLWISSQSVFVPGEYRMYKTDTGQVYIQSTETNNRFYAAQDYGTIF